MDVVDAVGEVADEFHVIDSLVTEVARVVVEAETFVISDGFEGAFGGGDVESDLGRVDFEGEIDVDFFENIQDGSQAFCKIIVALVQIRSDRWAERRRAHARCWSR